MNNKIKRVGLSPREIRPDLPINWNEIDVAMNSKWNENEVRMFIGLPSTFSAIYPAIIELSYLNPIIEDDNKNNEGIWAEFRHIKHGFPPIVVIRNEDGKLEIADGNHRTWWAQQKGLGTIGGWIVDKLLQEQIDQENLTETRIIDPDQSLHEGYITLYHGTIWPIALKAKKGELGPQEIRDLVIDILIKVFKSDPNEAQEYYNKHAPDIRKRSPNLLYLSTSRESAEMYARTCTKYGGEIFHDVISAYMWDKHIIYDRNKVWEHLMTNEPAVVTVNVPLSMVLTHPNWNTPLRARLRSILSPIRREKYKDIWNDITDLRMEVFVKEKIPARFVQRIDRIEPKGEKVDKINTTIPP